MDLYNILSQFALAYEEFFILDDYIVYDANHPEVEMAHCAYFSH